MVKSVVTKKSRKEKEFSRLRREIEILKAQVSGGRPKRTLPDEQTYSKNEPREEEKVTAKASEVRRVDPKYIKKDLLRTALLSVLAIAIILVLYLLRHQIPIFQVR